MLFRSTSLVALGEYPMIIRHVLSSADALPCSHFREVLTVGTSGAGSPVGAKASLLVLTYIIMWTITMDVLFDVQLCASERVMMYARNTERDMSALQSARQRQRHR